MQIRLAVAVKATFVWSWVVTSKVGVPTPTGLPERANKAATRAPPPTSNTQRKQPTVRTIVVRSLPTKFRVGELQRWLQEGNKDLAITGARWLLSDDRRLGEIYSSLNLYLADSTETPRLRMGKRSFRTTTYDWDRPLVSRPPN